jgi:hypothetical protein
MRNFVTTFRDTASMWSSVYGRGDAERDVSSARVRYMAAIA